MPHYPLPYGLTGDDPFAQLIDRIQVRLRNPVPVTPNPEDQSIEDNSIGANNVPCVSKR